MPDSAPGHAPRRRSRWPKWPVTFAEIRTQQALPALVKDRSPALLVMGAYGHNRLRQFLLGSTTTTLLRVSEVPVLVLR